MNKKLGYRISPLPERKSHDGATPAQWQIAIRRRPVSASVRKRKTTVLLLLARVLLVWVSRDAFHDDSLGHLTVPPVNLGDMAHAGSDNHLALRSAWKHNTSTLPLIIPQPWADWTVVSSQSNHCREHRPQSFSCHAFAQGALAA